MKVIYLAAYKAVLKYKNVVYNDIKINRDIKADMMDVDLTDYDILVATPPCNYYSRANYRRETSIYAQKTKHLLPDIIEKFSKTGKPYIVENVINKPLMKNIYNNFNGFIYEHGRHTYFTNVLIDFSHIPQKRTVNNIKHLPSSQRQGGDNVNDVIDYFISYVAENNFRKEKDNATNI